MVITHLKLYRIINPVFPRLLCALILIATFSGTESMKRNTPEYLALQHEKAQLDQLLELLHFPRRELLDVIAHQRFSQLISKKQLAEELGKSNPAYTKLSEKFNEASFEITNFKLLCGNSNFLNEAKLRNEFESNGASIKEKCANFDSELNTLTNNRDKILTELKEMQNNYALTHEDYSIFLRGLNRYLEFSKKTFQQFFLIDVQEHDKYHEVVEVKKNEINFKLNTADDAESFAPPSQMDVVIQYVCACNPPNVPERVLHEILVLRNLEWSYYRSRFIAGIHDLDPQNRSIIAEYLKTNIQSLNPTNNQLPIGYVTFTNTIATKYQNLQNYVQETLQGKMVPDGLFQDTPSTYADSSNSLGDFNILLHDINSNNVNWKEVHIVLWKRLKHVIAQKRSLLGIMHNETILNPKSASIAFMNNIRRLTELKLHYSNIETVMKTSDTSHSVMYIIRQELRNAQKRLNLHTNHYTSEIDITLDYKMTHYDLSKSQYFLHLCLHHSLTLTTSLSHMNDEDGTDDNANDVLSIFDLNNKEQLENMFPHQQRAIQECSDSLKSTISLQYALLEVEMNQFSDNVFSTNSMTKYFDERNRVRAMSTLVHFMIHEMENITTPGVITSYDSIFMKWTQNIIAELNQLFATFSIPSVNRPSTFPGRRASNEDIILELNMLLEKEERKIKYETLDQKVISSRISKLEWLSFDGIVEIVHRMSDYYTKKTVSNIDSWLSSIKSFYTALIQKHLFDNPTSYNALQENSGTDMDIYSSIFDPEQVMNGIDSNVNTMVLKRLPGRIRSHLNSLKFSYMVDDKVNMVLDSIEIIQLLREELDLRKKVQNELKILSVNRNIFSDQTLVHTMKIVCKAPTQIMSITCPVVIKQMFMELRVIEYELDRSNFIIAADSLNDNELASLQKHLRILVESHGADSYTSSDAKASTNIKEYEDFIVRLKNVYHKIDAGLESSSSTPEDITELRHQAANLEKEHSTLLRKFSKTEVKFVELNNNFLSGETSDPISDLYLAQRDIDDLIKYRKDKNNTFVLLHGAIRIHLKREVIRMRSQLGLFNDEPILDSKSIIVQVHRQLSSLFRSRQMLDDLTTYGKILADSNDFNAFTQTHLKRYEEKKTFCSKAFENVPLLVDTSGNKRLSMPEALDQTYKTLEKCLDKASYNVHQECINAGNDHWLLDAWLWNISSRNSALLKIRLDCYRDLTNLDNIYQMIQEQYLIHQRSKSGSKVAFSISFIEKSYLHKMLLGMKVLSIDGWKERMEKSKKSKSKPSFPKWAVALIVLSCIGVFICTFVLIKLKCNGCLQLGGLVRVKNRSQLDRNLNIIYTEESHYEMQGMSTK